MAHKAHKTAPDITDQVVSLKTPTIVRWGNLVVFFVMLVGALIIGFYQYNRIDVGKLVISQNQNWNDSLSNFTNNVDDGTFVSAILTLENVQTLDKEKAINIKLPPYKQLIRIHVVSVNCEMSDKCVLQVLVPSTSLERSTVAYEQVQVIRGKTNLFEYAKEVLK